MADDFRLISHDLSSRVVGYWPFSDSNEEIGERLHRDKFFLVTSESNLR